MTTIVNNFNFGNQVQFNGGNSPLNQILPKQLPAEITRPGSVMNNFLQGFQEGFAQGLMEGLQGAISQPTCPCEPPVPSDGGQQGGMKVDKATGEITTPGGYKIKPTAQFEWTVTGPDGKTTRIWGDPHVDENNDGKTEWDFKRPTTFMLGDGTKIDVSVAPYNDMTVTSGLQVINGNDRVVVSDIDKGKGKTSDVTQDGFQHVNDFGKNDVVVMGQNASEWSFQGKKITGSEKGGEVFKLGEELKPLTETPKQFGGIEQFISKLLADVSKMLTQMLPQTLKAPPFLGTNPYAGGNTNNNQNQSYNRDNHLQNLGNAFKAVGDMLNAINDLVNLTQQVGRRYTAI